MNGPTVIGLVLVIAALLVAAYVVGDAQLDALIARWRADLDDRRYREEWEQMQRDLAPTFPRVMKP
jgi:hypothetical protein